VNTLGKLLGQAKILFHETSLLVY